MEEDLDMGCCDQAACCAQETLDWSQPCPSPVEDWPYERSNASGSIYLSNIKFLLSTWDAAGFRVTPQWGVEFLVRNEKTQRLTWVNVIDMPSIPKAK